MEQDAAYAALTPPPPVATPLYSMSPPPIEIEKDFIITLESLPILWDKTHSHYSNKYKRNDALEILHTILIKIKPGATLEDVKKKINVLRSNYRRELKKIVSSRRSGSGANDIYIPKSWTFEYLKFLENFEQPVPLDRVTAVTGDNHNEANSDSPNPDQEMTTTISSFVSAPPPPSKRPSPLNTKKNVLKKQNELLERAVDYLSKPVDPTSDGLSIAFEWAETLKRLNPLQRLYAKKAINDILFEAELGNLDRYSVQINVTSTTSPAPFLYSNTPSPNYTHADVTAPPTQPPQYTKSQIASASTSSRYSHTPSPNYMPPDSSPQPNYMHPDVTAPPTQTPQYTKSQIASASTSSHYSHTPSPNYMPPDSSPQPNYMHPDVTAPPTQTPQYTKSQIASASTSSHYSHTPSPNYMPPDTSPQPNYTHADVTAPPPQPPQYTKSQISSASTSSRYSHSHTPSPNYMHTQTAPPSQSDYILHIPFPTMTTDSEYTAGSLFAQFMSGTDNGDE